MIMKIPKNKAIQIVVDIVRCTDEFSENVVDLVFAVVISWFFDVDELCEKKIISDQYLHILQEVLCAYQYTKSTNKAQTKIDKLK